MSEESYILRLLDECRDEIRVSDSKASIIFGAVAAATAILTDQLVDGTKALRTSGTAVTVIAVVAVGVLVVAMGLLGLAVIPRVGVPEAGKARYFEEQAQFTSQESLLAALAADAAVESQRHAHQLLTLARIARRKYRHLRSAMLAVLAASALLAIAILVASVT